MSRNFVGMSRTRGGVQKVCAKKVRAHFSFPIFIRRRPRGLARESTLSKVRAKAKQLDGKSYVLPPSLAMNT